MERGQPTADEIAEIRLLIEQGRWGEAEAAARRLLEAHPNSAAAHALMGDLAAARRQPREAVDWYTLAQRLAPDPEVAARLEQQQALLAAQSEAAFEAPAPRELQRRLLIGGIVGGFLLLALLIWLIGLAVSRKGEGAKERATSGSPAVERPAVAGRAGPSFPQESMTSPVPPVPGRRPSTNALPPSASRAAPTIPPAAASGPPVHLTQSVDAPLSDRDQWLTQALAGVTWPTGEALGWRVQAIVDDFTGYALVTALLPPTLRSGDIVGTVLQMAYRLGVATIQADKGVQSLTIRILAEFPGTGRRPQTLLAFRGNTTRQVLEFYMRQGGALDRQTLWERVFATSWWNPSVPLEAYGTATP